jgi:hypothetical protein
LEIALVLLSTPTATSSAESGVVKGVSPILSVARTPRLPALEDFTRDMDPSPELKNTFARVSGFVQRALRDGEPSTQKTDVYLAYDDENLYLAFVCFDTEPKRVRGRLLARGPEILDDDYVSVQIDTFRDQRRAYSFAANPLGVQNTAIWVEGQGWDYSFDTVWYSRGRRTDRGYVVWMSIPFRSLRFPPSREQSWGLMLERSIPRANEVAYWPSYSSRIEGRLNQAGLLTGIERVSPARNLELIPQGVFRAFRALSDGRPPVSGAADARMGLDAKLVVKDRLVLDATVNPDFSQIESDEPQATVNQRFEVFFPEKRPFFLENASFFQTPINLLFTRRIQEPAAGARLTGKLGSYAVGALLSDDRERGEAAEAHLGAFRVSRDVGNQSSLGLIYTHRAGPGGSNQVGGLDGRVKIRQNWTASFQAAWSSTRLPDASATPGTAYQLVLDRAGRQLNYHLEYKDRSPGFHTALGFDPRPDLRSLEQLVSFRLRPEGARLVSWGPDLLLRRAADHDGTELELTTGPAFHWELSGQTRFGAYYLQSREGLRPADFPELHQTSSFRTSQWGLIFSSAFAPQVSLSGGYASGGGINFSPPAGQPPGPAQLTSAEIELTLRPLTALTIDNRYLVTRISDRAGLGRVLDNHLLRSKWSYRLSRALSLRVIVQYDALSASPSRTRLSSTKNLNADFLLTYFLHHGTALYVGYNSNLREESPLGGAWAAPARFIRDSQELFVKFSCLVRF